jgi:hypothetical protein
MQAPAHPNKIPEHGAGKARVRAVDAAGVADGGHGRVDKRSARRPRRQAVEQNVEAPRLSPKGPTHASPRHATPNRTEARLGWPGRREITSPGRAGVKPEFASAVALPELRQLLLRSTPGECQAAAAAKRRDPCGATAAAQPPRASCGEPAASVAPFGSAGVGGGSPLVLRNRLLRLPKRLLRRVDHLGEVFGLDARDVWHHEADLAQARAAFDLLAPGE